MEYVSAVADRSLLKNLSPVDWLYALALGAGAVFALMRYSPYMDYYEEAILVLSVPSAAWLGWHWKSVRWMLALVATLALFAIGLYAGDPARGGSVFLLKYVLSSQSAILWMCTLFVSTR